MTDRPHASIAVVEDERSLREDLVEYLQLRGYNARGFASAETFFLAWPATRFDLLILDIILPRVSGIELAHMIRGLESTGIVMLTSLTSDADRIHGLDSGADAYLPKGSSLDVIEATCRSVLRRSGRTSEVATTDVPVAAQGAWRIQPKLWRLTAPNGSTADLTHAELTFVTTLINQPGIPVTREALLADLGKSDTLANIRNLDNSASRLRRKVESCTGMELPVRPSYGKGYTFIGECIVADT